MIDDWPERRWVTPGPEVRCHNSMPALNVFEMDSSGFMTGLHEVRGYVGNRAHSYVLGFCTAELFRRVGLFSLNWLQCIDSVSFVQCPSGL